MHREETEESLKQAMLDTGSVKALPLKSADNQLIFSSQHQIFTLRNKRSTAKEKAKKLLRNRLQILNWIGDYNVEWAINDLITGITLGLTIIPESIACALLAGLPVNYGLYSAFMGCFVYLFFGSIPKVIIGPTSLVALVSVQFTVGKPVEFAVLLTFLSGIVELIMGILQMGFIFEFISMPVIKAFSSATAILVIESQIKVLLGIKYVASGLPQSVSMLWSRLLDGNPGDLIMGIAAIFFLIALDLLEVVCVHMKAGKRVLSICRYLSFSRNTLIVVITALVSYFWINIATAVPYALSKSATSGLPNFTIPAMTVVTSEKTYSFWDVLASLNVGIFVVPIIGVLTNVSIGKLNISGMVNANQELLTVGVCNVLGSFVQSMPTSGAFTRYAISTACGLKTSMASLYSGIVVLLALSFLSPCFNYIPEPTLAAILICSIFTLLDLKLPRRLWKESKRDFGIWIFCFIICILFGVAVGLIASIFATMLHLLFLWARPEVLIRIEEIDQLQYVSVTPGNGIYFPAINHVREKVLKACAQASFKIPVVFDCRKINGLDYTAAQGISKLSANLSTADANSSALLVLYQLPLDLQKKIDLTDNLLFCESREKLREILTQESLRNGFINLKAHIRASIDLGYKIDVD